jgi:hypothetical protein
MLTISACYDIPIQEQKKPEEKVCAKNQTKSLEKKSSVKNQKSSDIRKTFVSTKRISFSDYYSSYVGHETQYLKKILADLKNDGCKKFIYLAGDSSLDNKFWLGGSEFYADAVNGYEKILMPAKMKKDINYWLNYFLEKKKKSDQERVCAINTAMEASKVAGRKAKLLEQDQFIKENISANDFLVISIGGNDVALSPDENIARALQKLANNANDSEAYELLNSIFFDSTKRYAERLIEKNKPQKVAISMIYFPDRNRNISSWASASLDGLKYNSNPDLLEKLIKGLFESSTKRIKIANTTVIPVALFEVLDGKNSSDYVSRVEPSIDGGKKIASLLLKKLEL